MKTKSPDFCRDSSFFVTGNNTSFNFEPILRPLIIMDVHKHSHHLTHKKRLGEYFLEFFMLFLAVFLGFIAENIREHTVETKRAKEYAYALLQDINENITQMDSLAKL